MKVSLDNIASAVSFQGKMHGKCHSLNPIRPIQSQGKAFPHETFSKTPTPYLPWIIFSITKDIR